RRRSARPVGAVRAHASPLAPSRTSANRHRALAALGRDASLLDAYPRTAAVQTGPDARDERQPPATAAPSAAVASGTPRRGREAACLVPPGGRARLRPRAPPRLEFPRAAGARRLSPLRRVRRRHAARCVLAAQPRVPERGVRRLGDRVVPVLGRPPCDRDGAADARLPARTRDNAARLGLAQRAVRDELRRRPQIRPLTRGAPTALLRGHR